MKYLLDTNVISETFKPDYNHNVRSFIEIIDWRDLYIPAITIGELNYGVEKLPHGRKKHELSIWLYTSILKRFDGRIISLDSEVFIEWGKLCARVKRTLSFNDSVIAACAIAHNMFLVTRNIKDFDDIDGINLLNPWEFGGE